MVIKLNSIKNSKIYNKKRLVMINRQILNKIKKNLQILLKTLENINKTIY